MDAYLDKTDWKRIRRNVFARDKGVCAACGCDTEKLERVIVFAAEGMKRNRYQARRIIGGLIGMHQGQEFWQADHIIERVRGGGNDLNNLQTLCVPCHKSKTAQFCRERAAARRSTKELPLFEGAA